MCERKKERKRGWKRKREYDACMELATQRLRGKLSEDLRGWVNKLGASLKLKRKIENLLTDSVRLAEDMKSSIAKLEAVVSTEAEKKSLNKVKFNLYR